MSPDSKAAFALLGVSVAHDIGSAILLAARNPDLPIPNVVPSLERTINPFAISELPAGLVYRYDTSASNKPPEVKIVIVALPDATIRLKAIYDEKAVAPGHTPRVLAQVEFDGNSYWTNAWGLGPWGAVNRDSEVAKATAGVARGGFKVDPETNQITILPGITAANQTQQVKPLNPDLVLFEQAPKGGLPTGGLFLEGNTLKIDQQIQSVEFAITGTQSVRIGLGGELRTSFALVENPHTGKLENQTQVEGLVRGLPFVSGIDYVTVTASSPVKLLQQALVSSTLRQQEATSAEITLAKQWLLESRAQNETAALRSAANGHDRRPNYWESSPGWQLSDVPWTAWVIIFLAAMYMARFGRNWAIGMIDDHMAGRGGTPKYI